MSLLLLSCCCHVLGSHEMMNGLVMMTMMTMVTMMAMVMVMTDGDV